MYVDFIVKLAPKDSKSKGEYFRWFLFVDGSSNLKESGACIILEGLDGVLIEQSLKFAFKDRNNQVKYEAMIVRMLLAKELGVHRLLAKRDSLLITGKVYGDY